MRFVCRSSDSAERAYFALEFLREVYELGKLSEIENMEDIFDALDISMELAELKKELEDYKYNGR